MFYVLTSVIHFCPSVFLNKNNLFSRLFYRILSAFCFLHSSDLILKLNYIPLDNNITMFIFQRFYNRWLISREKSCSCQNKPYWWANGTNFASKDTTEGEWVRGRGNVFLTYFEATWTTKVTLNSSYQMSTPQR